MTPKTALRYLLGNGDAIREVASSRAAFWTGMALVIITTIPRNYDQTFIGESPLKWLFGSLAFSLVSGTWVFVIAYYCCAWRKTRNAEGKRPRVWHQWPAFMGLFWMTAPIAWLYSIPVERFLDSLPAARTNVALLAIVSFWRVALMARVFQCLCGVSYFIALLWVLTAALGETLVVTLFGGTMAKAIMAGMGGMRNSPEEEVLRQALGVAFTVSFFGFPVVGVITAVVNSLALIKCTAWPERQAQAVPRWMLATCALAWAAVAVYPQVELSRNVEVEQRVAAGHFREAIELMAARQPGEFAPSRPLPPKAFEREVFTQLPQCLRELKASDPEWVRRHFMTRLDQMCSHLNPRWMSGKEMSEAERVKHAFGAMGGYWWREMIPSRYVELLEAMERLPEGRSWLASNKVFVAALDACTGEPPRHASNNSKSLAQHYAEWQEVRKVLDRIHASSGPVAPATNTPPP